MIYKEWLCGIGIINQSNPKEDIYCINPYLDKAWRQISEYYWYGEEALLIILNSEVKDDSEVWNAINKIYLEPEDYAKSHLELKMPSFLQASLDALIKIYKQERKETFKSIEEWHKILVKYNDNLSLNEGRWNNLIKRNMIKQNLSENIKGRRNIHKMKLLNLLKTDNEDISPEVELLRKAILSAESSDLKEITNCSAENLINLACEGFEGFSEIDSTSISEISELSSTPKLGQSLESPLAGNSILNYQDSTNEIEEVNRQDVTSITTDDSSSIILQQDFSASDVGTSVSIPSYSPSFMQDLDYEMKAYINFAGKLF
uniref:Uncharacterized protein n=1 Tax=Meloidogyne hapla TaxID=6305 RepID=A0A1I8BEL0_MELHA